MPSPPKRGHDHHERTRRDHASEIAEDYVEAIQEIGESTGACRVIDLAKEFGVTSATVNRTVGRLERDGLVETEPYKPIRLTPRGRRLATRSRERHATVLAFLLALGVSDEVAAIDSEGIEHHVSGETLEAMQRYINRQPSR